MTRPSYAPPCGGSDCTCGQIAQAYPGEVSVADAEGMRARYATQAGNLAPGEMAIPIRFFDDVVAELRRREQADVEAAEIVNEILSMDEDELLAVSN